jgi:arsenate reductase
MKMKILILCTGNSCRSQMAEGFFKSFDKTLAVFSAGTFPADAVNPYAIRVMQEAGIDISRNHPKNVSIFTGQSFDYVLTVCDDARESCPFFTGEVKYRSHISFEDPAGFIGSEEETLAVYRHLRDKIRKRLFTFYTENIRS